MIVLKLGGSLLSKNALLPFLELASQDGKGQVIIVPGGGVFADQVRLTQKQWQYNDQTAHYMAILAMQQMALLFQGLCPELLVVNKVAAILPNMQPQNAVIWSPLASELDAAEIPANWDITSDTLAAWLAVELSIDHLTLVKSCELLGNSTVEQLSALGIIDHSFTNFVDNQSLTVDCISHQQISTLATRLKKHV
ncbi:uridylate kinase [Methylococcaceae bacterium HT1]|nr:uridylate kinase [Methylococcaceae bacterium HT1]TXL23863.1 uridylate kinase [Methylococcaceae bacterium HT2]